MIVRCANCQTEFSLDDRQVGPEGASLRCSVCSYVFRVEARRSGTRTWQIRTVDEMQFFAPDLKTLRAWITEGRLHPDDQVSRTGKHWLRLGDMPEFSSSFAGFRGLPEVFVALDSEALDQLGPPPSFAGESDDGLGVPELTSPPPPTGAIRLDGGEAGDRVKKRVGSRPLPSALGTEPVLSGRRPPPPPHPGRVPQSKIPTEQPAVSGETRSEDAPPSIGELGGSSPARAAHRSGPVAVAVAEEEKGVVVPKTRAAVESSGQRRAASMLDAVTSLVQPVTRPAEERAADVSSSARRASASTSGARPRDFEDESPDLDRSRPPGEPSRAESPARRSSWPLVAGLGVLTGVAVVFGIPSVRDRVLGAADSLVDSSGSSPVSGPGATEALASLDAEALAEATSQLRARGDASSLARAAEIVATEALLAAIEARVEARPPSPRPAALDGAVGDAGSDPRAGVLVALARGGVPDATAADRETQLIAAAAPLWRDPKAAVPAGVISGLEGLPERSGLASIVLALAYWRGGDERRAGEIVEAQLQRSPGQATATALARALEGTGGAPGAGAETGTAGAAAVAVDASGEVDAPGTGGAAVGDDGAGTSGGSTPAEDAGAAAESGTPPVASEPRLSVDGLISRGCGKVESGDASGGVKLLERAYDQRPADVDATLCLGQGYAKLGSHGTALKYFERTLERSPKFVAALRGAAKSAARLGKTSKAVGFYERLLAVDPGNSDAKAYLAEHAGGDADEPSPPDPGAKPKEPEPEPEPEPPTP